MGLLISFHDDENFELKLVQTLLSSRKDRGFTYSRVTTHICRLAMIIVFSFRQAWLPDRL
jgi:hypothetical protein